MSSTKVPIHTQRLVQPNTCKQCHAIIPRGSFRPRQFCSNKCRMTAFDGKQIIRAAEFDQDERARTFTLCRADNRSQFTYSLSRFEKLSAARYTSWSLVVPDRFRDFAKEHAFRHHFYWGFIKGLDAQSVLKPKERMDAVLRPKERADAHQ
jgi:hypothetical protein